MGFQINFGDTSQYERFEGGGGELLPNEGIFTGEITGVTEGESGAGNKTLTFAITCRDDDVQGKKVMKTIPVTGKRKDGKDNVHGLIQLLESVYSKDAADDTAIQAKVAELNGKNLNSDDLAKTLKGQSVFMDVVARSYVNKNGQTVWSSDIRNFVVEGKLTDAKGINAHRRALPPKAQAYLDGDATEAGGGATTGMTAAAATDIV